MKKIMIICILFLALGIGCGNAQNPILLGVIIDENGDTASYAPGIKAAINLAVSDLNDSYAKSGMNTTVESVIAGTDGTQEGAINAAEDLIAKGVSIIVQPGSSEEVAGILPILTREGVISVNPTSSKALSKPGDPIIRLIPDDGQMLVAVEKYYSMREKDSHEVQAVILARDDLYGEMLSGEISFGTNIVDIISYPQNTDDYTQTLEKLNNRITSLLDAKNGEDIEILAISFDEISQIMAQASAYPALQKVHWTGMDGVALNPTILLNETAAEFAYITNLTALAFNIAQPDGSDYWRVYDTIKAATNGQQPTINEILPYDGTLMAAWIMQNNPSSLEEMLYIAENYGKLSYAATGWLKLNENNDREYGDYYFYQVKKGEDGSYFWAPVYAYMYGNNDIVVLTGVDSRFMKSFYK